MVTFKIRLALNTSNLLHSRLDVTESLHSAVLRQYGYSRLTFHNQTPSSPSQREVEGLNSLCSLAFNPERGAGKGDILSLIMWTALLTFFLRTLPQSLRALII